MLAVVSTSCIQPAPPHHTGSFTLDEPVHYGGPPERVEIEGVVQKHEQRFFRMADDLPTLIVELKLNGDDISQPWLLNSSDIELIADLGEGSRLVADDDDAVRSPNRFFVHDGDDWAEAKSVQVNPGQSPRVRVHYRELLPYTRPERDGTRYAAPADLRLSVPTPDEAPAELVISDSSEFFPEWERDFVDHRPFVTIGGSIIGFGERDLGTTLGFFGGAQHEFPNKWYLRWGFDAQVGILLRNAEEANGGPVGVGEGYIQAAFPVTAGYRIGFPGGDATVGAGWAPGLNNRATSTEPAFPHWGVVEFSMIPRQAQSYPYRDGDFAGNFGIFTRLMVQSGNFGGRQESSGFLLTVGLAIHPNNPM